MAITGRPTNAEKANALYLKEKFQEIDVAKNSLDFLIDGAVVKLNDVTKRKELQFQPIEEDYNIQLL